MKRGDYLFCGSFNQKLRNWVAGNRRLNKALYFQKGGFIRMQATENPNLGHIIVDFREFSYGYYFQFVQKDPDAYCNLLIHKIDSIVFMQISESIEPYKIKFEFILQDNILIKYAVYQFQVNVFGAVSPD